MGTSVRIVDGKETGRNEPWDRLLANTNELTDIQMLSIHYAATCISAKIWRRKLIGNTRFIASMNYGEDALFTHRILTLHCISILTILRLLLDLHGRLRGLTLLLP